VGLVKNQPLDWLEGPSRYGAQEELAFAPSVTNHAKAPQVENELIADCGGVDHFGFMFGAIGTRDVCRDAKIQFIGSEIFFAEDLGKEAFPTQAEFFA
jgi:hypothetical protein